MDKTIYMDTSSAILLFHAKLLDPLSKGYRLIIPPSVFKEATKKAYPGATYFKNWKEIDIIPPRDEIMSGDLLGMGAGERDCIRLLMESGHEAFLLVDDKKAAKFCRSQGLPFINALLVPKIFYYNGMLSLEMAREKEDELAHLGRYSRFVLDTAKTLNRADLIFFLR
ncbi:MAG: hypothetical protein MI749_07400 [Desulfovibrionales bacterium]|nr:hypothetical protein [Desulfovibrionales bacterium]